MAETSTVARPYAKAAFEFAHTQGALEAWSEMLTLAAGVIADDAMRSRVLDNPRLSGAEKADIVLDVGGEAFSEEVRNFLRTLGQSHRLAALPDIAEQFEQLKAEQEKRLEVTIVSAFPLDAAQQDTLASALAKRLNREISITTQVDRALMGGVILRAGDTVIDGSVRNRLARLRDTLSV
ncbi:F0F1 ATP synthase subunit delta [Modicisalibacter tunisiensis]|uniref:ATP synthase subunit delta n=1 Tax=Modicisalibacter tunisiensis TaxID=390637 RepID=A0ABS7WWC7_9GAMM|nr:F0F1 ATP synthase subunit delta [Modicisalibacter tunisiensis]KXS38222.1 MAG: F-type H+-transporting ATPase subunit delta [Halomonadaceae bacterium T82-2]MBZ9566914.1 F0F1 ATP synthase subunit delta [Modicisalibacter tunisiensis]